MQHFQKSNPGLIPDEAQLTDFLKIESCNPPVQLIVSQMLDPLKDALLTCGKKIRFEMVEIGFKACAGKLTEGAHRQLQICEQIIEGLHLGSMIIDDIQDQSEVRRGKPTFHRKYGMGPALNAGNWLYFQSIQQVQFLGLESEQELLLQRRINEILLKAHCGQGIDVGVNMNTLPQHQVEATYFTSAELKTGALMELAFELGSFVARSQRPQAHASSKHAKNFGIALQILDDIGNYLAPPPKGKEDLKIGRPSFIWVTAARLTKAADYERFKSATRMLPDPSFINSWSALFDLIPASQSFAADYLKNLKTHFLESIPESEEDLTNQVESLFSKLEKAYG